MQLHHYMVIIKRRFWLILLGMLICVSATATITTIKRPVYEAIATVEVADPGTDIFGNQAEAVTLAIQITNPDVLKQVASTLPGTTLTQLMDEVSASPLDNTQLIAVQADASTPQQSVAIANTVAQVFIQQTLAAKTTRLQATAKQLAAQLVTAKTNMDQAEQQLTQLQQNNGTAAQIQQANDQLANYQSNYDALSASYTSIQTQETQVAGSLILDQAATLPTGPSGMSRSMALGIAAALSFLLMLVFVLLLDWLDVTIKTPEDVAQLAHLEPLGSVPLQRSGLPALLSQTNSASAEVGEQAFTVISTNFHALYKGQRALLVTSLHHAAGTSTIAARLALNLAQSGLRVLLVDANLRKPNLHETFQVVNVRGLTGSPGDTYALQKQPTEIYSWLQMWTTQVPNLWLLPTGPVTVPPTSVLRSPELQKLVRQLLEGDSKEAASSQKLIDLIIFDTPAFLDEADATVLALLCDSSLLVVEAAKERKEALQKASAALQRLGAPVLGVVVNRQKAGHSSYLYSNSQAQDSQFEARGAVEAPPRYALRPFSFQQNEFVAPRLQPELLPTSLLPQPAFLSPLPQEAVRGNAINSSERIPPRPSYGNSFKEPEMK